MLNHSQIPLHRLILSFSDAMDQVHPRVADHQQRTAFIATRIARQMGFTDSDLLDVFYAAALHDIGLITSENRITAVSVQDMESVSWHSEVGYELLKTHKLFAEPARIVRYHHLEWGDGRGSEFDGREVPLASHIVTLADSIELAIHRNVPVLDQTSAIIDKVRSRAGSKFHPDCVEAFLAAARPEAFWLDAVSPRIYSVLLQDIDWPTLIIDEVTIEPIAELFGRLVDAASPWTAVHSAGVAATAVSLAEELHFSPRELHLMRAAGYLHDLGKLGVPGRILDKSGKLTPEEYLRIKTHTYFTYRILETIGGLQQIAEWAAFHHERLDGEGYPFRLSGDDLTLGSRIMAVADVFTALLEDRPYRKGMPLAEAAAILNKMVREGALDGEVVKTLDLQCDKIDDVRRMEQVEYGAKQAILFNLIGQEISQAGETELMAAAAG